MRVYLDKVASGAPAAGLGSIGLAQWADRERRGAQLSHPRRQRRIAA